ncbi:MAG: ATP-binding cassette domain-containing protein [Pseudomonadota bacterium]
MIAQDRSRILGLLTPLLLFGLIANLGMLVSPLFMMQMLDRVVPSGNMATLAMLLLIAVAFIALGAIIDARRTQILKHTSNWVEQRVMSETQLQSFPNDFLLVSVLRHPARARSTLAILDIPWIVLFAAVLLVLHPIFGAIVAVSLIIVFGLTLWRAHLENSAVPPHAAERNWIGVLEALGADRDRMGLGARVLDRIKLAASGDRAEALPKLSVLARMDAARNFLRQGTSLALLAAGGALVAQDALTAGGMIAASLIGTKTLSLTEAAIDSWPEFRKLKDVLQSAEAKPADASDAVIVNEPSVSVVKLTVPKGKTGGFRLQNVSFELGAGRCLAILGPSGAGKTTLLDILSGSFPAPLGQVRLGGHDLARISAGQRHQLIGFMAQAPRFDVGTVAEIISCFEPTPSQDKIEDAAILAGVHSTVLGLPRGYVTDLKEDGHILSAGQMQRLSLARALYNQPKLLILDEPNALQDSLGEQQMADALSRIKASGVTIIMVVHRVGIMWLADDALVLDKGRVVDFGPRGHVLARRSQTNRVLDTPLTDGGVQDVEDWISNQFQRSSDTEFRYRAILVATEMYNFMRGLAGDEAAQRQVKMEFSFVDGDTCTISIREEGNDGLNARAGELKRLVTSDNWVPDDLDEIGMSMVMLSRAAETLDVVEGQGATEIIAKLASDLPIPEKRAH